MEPFFIILGAVIIILLLVLLLGGKKKSWRTLLGFFVEEVDAEAEGDSDGKPQSVSTAAGRKKHPLPADPKAATRRNPNQAYTEMAILMQKIDERRRVVDSSGHSTLYDEYFELVFETRKGGMLHLVASRAAFKEVPFNQEGAVTYKHGTMIKFKYAGGLISDEYSPARR